jgi:hypothetical protein
VDETESLEQRAERLTTAYRRQTWKRFVLVFFPVPFLVLLVRLQLDAWHYYVAGAAYLIFSGALYSYDSAAAIRRDAAMRAAEAARRDGKGRS